MKKIFYFNYSRRRWILLCTTMCIMHLSYAQNPLVKMWDKRYGGSDWEYLRSIQQTFDGGYILGGYSRSDISGDKTQNTQGGEDYWIVKTDSTGNKQWDKDFGGTAWQHLTSLQQTSDGGYILGGYSMSGIGGDKTETSWGSTDFWIIKTDFNGNKIWDRDYGGTAGEWLSSIQQTLDGGYILGGYSTSDSSGDKTQNTKGDRDYWIVKIDSIGNKLWDKDFGGTDEEVLNCLMQTSDGGFILAGYSLSGIGGDKSEATWGGQDYWIVKTDSLGNKQWDKDFGGTESDRLTFIRQTTDGGYILIGESWSGISGDKSEPKCGILDHWMIKIDAFGNKQWDKDIGGCSTQNARQISQTTDGGYLISGFARGGICGQKTENNIGAQQAWVVKTDSLGNIVWDKTLRTLREDIIGLAIQTSDGCYIMGTQTAGGIGGDKTQPNWDSWNMSYDYWIVKYCDTSLCAIPRPLITRVDDSLFVTDQFMSYQWYNDTVAISGATDYFYYAPYITDGIYYVVVTDSNGCSARSDNSIINSDRIVIKGSHRVIVYPNPVSHELKIKVETPGASGLKIGSFLTISIYDILGKMEIQSQAIDFKTTASASETSIDVSDLPPGIYWLEISAEENIIRTKFVKQ